MKTSAARHTLQSYLYIQELDAAIRNLCLNPDHSRVGVVLPRHLVIVKQLRRSLQLRATHCDKKCKPLEEAMRGSRGAVGQTARLAAPSDALLLSFFCCCVEVFGGYCLPGVMKPSLQLQNSNFVVSVFVFGTPLLVLLLMLLLCQRPTQETRERSSRGSLPYILTHPFWFLRGV